MLDFNSIGEDISAGNFNAILKENSRLPGPVAMDIYRNNSIGARRRALELIYPVVEKILGERCFNGMANDFVIASPSLDSNLNNYGQAFPDFLAGQVLQRPAFSDYMYLPDLARLEWFYHAAYYAPDDELNSELSSVSLACSCAQFYLSTSYPVYDIWRGHQGNEDVKEVPALTGVNYLLVYRQQGHPEVERINRDEWIILQELAVARNVESVVERTLEKGVDVQRILPDMIQKGWVRITGYRIE